jgi:hypothetical protein
MAAVAISDGSSVHDHDYLVDPHSHRRSTKEGELRYRGGDPPSVALVPPGHSMPEDKVSLCRPILMGRCPQSDLHLHDTWISRRHCELIAVDDGLLVRDVGSKHGTFVNHEHVEQKLLRDGDTLSIGLTNFLVSYEN